MLVHCHIRADAYYMPLLVHPTCHSHAARRIMLYSFAPELNLSRRCADAVCHGSDLPMWWSPSEPASLAKYTVAERTLGGAMISYINTFAAIGRPGSGSALQPVEWPAVTNSHLPRLQLDIPIRLLDDPAAAECVMWDNLPDGYVFPPQ